MTQTKERRIQVIDWPECPLVPQWIFSVTCEHCNADLTLPTAPGTRIIATKGMGIFFDNTTQPKGAIPRIMRCPVCRHQYRHEEAE